MKKLYLLFALTFAFSSLQAKTTSPPILPMVVEVAFSPEAGSEALVLKVIDSSTKSIKLAAYSFTSPKVVKALLDASKKPGMVIEVLMDQRGNQSAASQSAIRLLNGAGIEVRMIGVYAIHHDKYIISDDETVQTGSFNYSQAAAKSNSENVMVTWRSKSTAQSFLIHWDDRWAKGKLYLAA